MAPLPFQDLLLAAPRDLGGEGAHVLPVADRVDKGAAHDHTVWVEDRVRAAVRRYAGHSLRAGFVTSAAAAGARLDEIMDQTHQTDVKTVMRYVRNARAIRLSAAARLGL